MKYKELTDFVSNRMRMSHATIALTLDTYNHVLPRLQEAAARAFDENLLYVADKKRVPQVAEVETL